MTEALAAAKLRVEELVEESGKAKPRKITHRMILGLSNREESHERRQFLIDRVIENSWVRSTVGDYETFGLPGE